MLLRRISYLLARNCELTAGAIFAIVCVINVAQVFGRYMLGSSLSWAEEIMRYSMVWVMMLGSTTAIYHGDHMVLDTVVGSVPVKWRHLLRSILFGIAAVFCFLLVWYGWPAAINNIHQKAAASGISMVYPYMALPIGGVLMIIQIILCWIVGFRDPAVEEEAW